MKKITLLIFILIGFSCEKKTASSAKPATIYVSGQVVHKIGLTAFDSVYVGLEYEKGICVGCIAQEKEHKYTDKSGNFSFTFDPESGYSYHLNFESAHSTDSRSISLDESHQTFTVTLGN